MRQRVVADETAFTLIELLVVLAILGILMAIALISYVGFKDRANQRAANADVRAAIPSAVAYFADHNTYAGMTKAVLQASYDRGLNVDSVADITATGSCFDKTVGNKVASYSGPSGSLDETSLCS